MPDRPHLPPFAALRAFEAFGRHGGVRRTAAALGVSHAIVSRHLRALEDWLSVMLVDRQHGGLTPAGESYHALIGPAFDQLCTATSQARGQHGTRLDVWSVAGLAYLWLTPNLPGFGRRHPGMALDLRPSDSPPDLSRREAHGDIRWYLDDAPGLTPPRSLMRQAVVRPRLFPVARADAPWLKDAAVAAPQDLLALPLLHEDSDAEWRAWFAAQGLAHTQPPVSARLWQAHMTLAAAADGQGVAITNGFLAAEHLQSGRLVELGAGNPAFAACAPGAYYFTARADMWDAQPIARFRAWLAEAVAASPPDWLA
ncbi:LysR substrate-binding domain-containing protein [Novosphingobium pokkalii]|uniref:LysR substrate-binding domain-containing protein n=1 Tax=Novosphingobium pokkalii TaxID=1770194 RepID=A0ABV7UYL4_9SPHN|nr:LysR substrate-binding domain-containing protein [Novosphingobium pokkalii]GHC95655.1 LysR family transcriptional regulator [Novosphingobium pokkalii]